ncbi:LCP family protein [Bailinhaonella thermotolerans]|uniref:LytR family transcriptional regulator n=1 Tax=Bailinhaonella thermotolerans TaxID=1070861 RepID=A0A3A4B2J1_9ACTN|nr:LCP family protein [Bailinhaonella thermotolerans]RJL31610.1 LytR family transcriptional regulator [Bailinhaonella thermotolerans]
MGFRRGAGDARPEPDDSSQEPGDVPLIHAGSAPTPRDATPAPGTAAQDGTATREPGDGERAENAADAETPETSGKPEKPRRPGKAETTGKTPTPKTPGPKAPAGEGAAGATPAADRPEARTDSAKDEAPTTIGRPPAADGPGGEDTGKAAASAETPGKTPARRRPTPWGIVGWTALSIIAPGAAHLRAGRKRLGAAILGTYLVVLLGVAAFALSQDLGSLGGFAIRDSTIMVVIVAAIVLALVWFVLVLSSYIVQDPDRLTGNSQIGSGLAVGVLCVAVMAPFGLTARNVISTRNDLNDIFPSSPGGGVAAKPIDKKDPWAGYQRVNFLLLGGDAARNRVGVRTDSMTVASVDVKSGNTVLFSLPRNLQYVRFPKGHPLHRQFPNGFQGEPGSGGLLNEVWEYADAHPEVMGAKHTGPEALKTAIGHTLGLKIDYYALVDMWGFAELIDAIGGLTVKVEQDVQYGPYGQFSVKKGTRLLSGEEVLWYGRSRTNSSDYVRMGRQRCLLGAIAKQANPALVLTRFEKIFGAAKRMFKTDIPRDLLEHLVPLGLKVKDAKITSLQFVPPLISTGNPDWAKIRRETLKAIKQSEAASETVAAIGTAAPDRPAATPSPGAPKPTKTPKPKPTGTGGSSAPDDKPAKRLDEVCAF